MSKPCGVVLAGGASRRFGSPKALAKYEGVPFYKKAISALRPHVEELVLVSHLDILENLENDGFKPILDDPKFRGDGPLAGLYSAMRHVQANVYLVIPCDMPLLTSEQITSLVSNYNEETMDALIPIIDGREQPLVAIYHRRCLEVIENLLTQKNRKLQLLLNAVNVHYLSEDEIRYKDNEFSNINSKDDYKQFVDKNKS